MPLPQEISVGISLIIYQMMLIQASRRRRLMYNIQRLRQSDYGRRQRIRRFYERQAHERMVFMMMLSAWAYASCICNKNLFTNQGITDWWNLVAKQSFSDHQWMEHFKVSKNTFRFIVTKLTSKLVKNTSKQLHGINSDKQVAILLSRLGCGKSCDEIATLFGINEACVADVLKEVCDAIVNVLMPQFIKVPSGNDLKEVLEEFESKFGFPHCAGALGAVYIPIKPPLDNATDYINADGECSVVLQCIVDSFYKFWDLNIGWPGSVPLARILTSSSLWNKGQSKTLFPDITRTINDLEVPVLILGGSSYPLVEWIMKAYQNIDPIPKDLQKYNDHFECAYFSWEVAVKRLKARWSYIQTQYDDSLESLPNLAAACCTLHNLCEHYNEPVLDEWITETVRTSRNSLSVPSNVVIGESAEDIRDALTQYFSE